MSPHVRRESVEERVRDNRYEDEGRTDGKTEDTVDQSREVVEDDPKMSNTLVDPVDEE